MSSTRSRGALAAILAALAGILVLALPGAASARDRNHDHISDRWEKHYNLSLKVNQARRDQDRDGLNNRQEFRAKTNPRRDDSNRDGTPDDEENAGTIESFDGTTLTIDLFAGGTVSGTVTDETEIHCGCNHPGDGGEGDGKASRHDGGPGDGDGDGPPEHEGPGHGGPGHRGPGHDGDENECTVDDLVAGAVVHEAELKVTDDGTTYEEVDLVPQDPSDGS